MSDLYIPGLSKDGPVEFVEGLADNFTALENGELNYSPASPDSDWKPTKVAEALDVLAGSRIIEWGSNENGEYWRWESGLQLCLRGYTSSNTFSIGTTNEYIWTFPAKFFSGDYFYRSIQVVRTDVEGAPSAMITRIKNEPAPTVGISFKVKNTSGSQQVIQTSGMAIGLWKELEL